MAKSGRVTIVDVARHAGVSRQTVSNALMHPERVKPPTLQHVRQVIEALGYRPSSAARSLRSQRAGAVGFELNTLGAANRNDVAYPFAVALGTAARSHDCHVVIFGSPGAKPMIDAYHDMVRAQLVDAFVIADTHHADPRPEWLDRSRVPYAAFGRIWDDAAATSWVGRRRMPPACGPRQLHLLDAGYPRVGYLGWPAGSDVGDDRQAGWVDALAARGIRERQEATAGQDLVAAYDAALGLVEEIGPYGAMTCASDLLAVGVERAVHERGLGGRPGLRPGGFRRHGPGDAARDHLGDPTAQRDRLAILLELLQDRRGSVLAAGRRRSSSPRTVMATRSSSSPPRANRASAHHPSRPSPHHPHKKEAEDDVHQAPGRRPRPRPRRIPEPRRLWREHRRRVLHVLLLLSGRFLLQRRGPERRRPDDAHRLLR